MKKVMKKVNFALIALMASAPAFAAPAGGGSTMCAALERLHTVFEILRTLAFVGAAFYIAGWAWEFISAGKVDMGKVKERGIGLLVGFALLFMIGLLLSFILSTPGASLFGCEKVIRNW